MVVVLLVSRAYVRAFILTHIGSVVGREDVRVRVFDAPAANLLVVDEDRGRAALASAVAIVSRSPPVL